MKCPFTSKCHNSLARELDEARAAHKDTICKSGEVIGALKSEISVLKFRLSMIKPPNFDDLSDKARRRISGYTYSRNSRPKHPCKSCDSIDGRLNYDDKIISHCHEFKHTVNGDRGRCPNHSDLIEIEKAKVA